MPKLVNKSELSDLISKDVRTLTNWQKQGMPIAVEGGRGKENLYDIAVVMEWYSDRKCEPLNLRIQELTGSESTEYAEGTIEYETHRLTKARADAQNLANQKAMKEVVETEFATFTLSRIAAQIGSILDTVPLNMRRKFPELETKHIEHLKREIVKAQNIAAGLDTMLPELLDEYLANTS